MNTQELMKSARSARTALAAADTETKNRALLLMAEALENSTGPILAANGEDMDEEFIHHNERKSFLPFFKYILFLLKQMKCHKKHIIKINFSA